MPAFGAATNLVAGTLTLTLPAGTRYWYLQNQDITPLKVTFPAGSGFGPVTLAAATSLGEAGDWLCVDDVPFYGESVVLSSSTTTAQFGSGSTKDTPTKL